jgi:prepilin signal peptidase PulO-like enzyme (type II secretory pathway)
MTVLWLAYLHLCLFLVGCCVGSFLNVCIYRMGTGRSISWPGSHCGSCFTAIPMRHNVPLVSYLLLRGRCAVCGASFSARYFLVELLTGVVFAGLFALEVGWNWNGYPIWHGGGWWHLSAGLIPPHAVPLWLAHVFLASLLIVAIGTLADTGDVPPAAVIAGALVGFIWAVCYPWPEPVGVASGFAPGFVFWPAWYPLLPGEPVVTALAGVLLMPAVVRLVDRGGALRPVAAVALMGGGFLGWQPVAVALLLAAAGALITRRGVALWVALLVPVVWLSWRVLGPPLRPVLFHPAGAAGLLVGVTGLLWVAGPAAVTGRSTNQSPVEQG